MVQTPTDLGLASAHRCRAYDTIPQEHMLEYYKQRAIGSEGGLILLEGTSVSHIWAATPATSWR